MKTLFAALLLSISANSFADNNTFRLSAPFKGLYINASADGTNNNGQDGSISEPENPECDNPENIGSSHIDGQCSGKIIVDNKMLRQLVESEGDYSDETIYTGQVTDMSNLFSSRNPIYSISRWDTSNVTNMSQMFYRSNPIYDITEWDTSNVTNMYQMFAYSGIFNQDISGWDVSKVTSMESMFNRATDFNHDIGNWDTSKVTNFNYMFYRARGFNQDIGNWNVSNATNMGYMFNDANAFSADLSNWCVTKFNSEPPYFSLNSALTTENKPLWGTCP